MRQTEHDLPAKGQFEYEAEEQYHLSVTHLCDLCLKWRAVIGRLELIGGQALHGLVPWIVALWIGALCLYLEKKSFGFA